VAVAPTWAGNILILVALATVLGAVWPTRGCDAIVGASARSSAWASRNDVGRPRPLAVKVTWSYRIHSLIALAAFGALFAPVGLGLRDHYTDNLLWISFGVFTILLALKFWPGSRPLVVIDFEGVRVPHLGVVAPWSAISEVDVAAGRAEVIWCLAGQQSARSFTTLPAWRRWWHRGELDAPLTLSFDATDTPPEIILHRSWAYLDRAGA
jgi:hypothetical protein